MEDIEARNMARAAERRASQPLLVDTTAGSRSLTDAQAAGVALTFLGNPGADVTITLPQSPRVQRLRNETTGAFRLKVRRGASGTPLTIPQNETIEVR